MNKPRFTPGAWKAHKRPERNGMPEYWEIHYSDDGECVAEVVHGKANAYLMAASKDMYNALNDLVALLDSDDPIEVGCHCTDSGNGPVTCTWCKAKQVLAKVNP